MKRGSKRQLNVRAEIVAILGNPQFISDLSHCGVSVRVFCWYVTSKGKRAGERFALEVAADKARDLDADVYFVKNVRCHRGEFNATPCEQSEMEGICVWVKP